MYCSWRISVVKNHGNLQLRHDRKYRRPRSNVLQLRSLHVAHNGRVNDLVQARRNHPSTDTVVPLIHTGHDAAHLGRDDRKKHSARCIVTSIPVWYMSLPGITVLLIQNGHDAEHHGPADQGREHSARYIDTSNTSLVHATARKKHLENLRKNGPWESASAPRQWCRLHRHDSWALGVAQ